MAKQIKVKVIKLAGETGLLKPGRILLVDKKKAERWIKSGWVEEVKPAAKPKKHKNSQQSGNTKVSK